MTGWEDYAALFYDNDNPEGIWVKHYDPNHPDAWSDPESTTMGVVHTVPPGPGNLYEGWGTFDVTQNLIDKFQMADGTPYVKPSGITTENPWEGREIRLKANILCDGDLWGYGDDEREVEVYVGSDDIIRQAFNTEPKDNDLFIPGMMSRKKQLIPTLTALWG